MTHQLTSMFLVSKRSLAEAPSLRPTVSNSPRRQRL